MPLLTKQAHFYHTGSSDVIETKTTKFNMITTTAINTFISGPTISYSISKTQQYTPDISFIKTTTNSNAVFTSARQTQITIMHTHNHIITTTIVQLTTTASYKFTTVKQYVTKFEILKTTEHVSTQFTQPIITSTVFKLFFLSTQQFENENKSFVQSLLNDSLIDEINETKQPITMYEKFKLAQKWSQQFGDDIANMNLIKNKSTFIKTINNLNNIIVIGSLFFIF